MSKTRDTGFINNILKYDNDGNVSVVSGSTTLLFISSSGAIITTGIISGSNALSASYAVSASNSLAAQTASYVLNAQTASYVLNGVSASYAASASNSISGAYAVNSTTASFSLTGTSASYSNNTTLAANSTLFNNTASTVFATTGSNTLTGTQYISNTNNATGFSNTTSSIYTDGGLQVTKDAYFSSSMFIKGNLTVFGTQSVSFISSSQLNIGTNLITVNTDTPSIRFGGLAVYDSGSTGLTGSILWDSQNNHWVYTNPSGSSYSGGMLISGPRASSLGSEQGTTNNALMKGMGGDHITSSAIFESASFVGIGTSSPAYTLDVQGTGRFTGALTGSSATFSGNIRRQSSSTVNTELQSDGVYATGTDLYLLAPSGRFVSIYSNNAEAVRITSAGNVGIGTNAPSMELDVSGSGLGGGIRSMGASGASGGKGVEIGYELGDFGTVLAYDRTGGVFKQLRINDLIHVGTGSAGNVGIGYTGPTAKLQVSGTIAAGSSTTGWGRFSYDATTNQVRIQASKDGTDSVSLSFYTQASGGGFAERMIITGSYVGIGTSDPGQTLEVRSADGQGIRFKNAGSSDKRWDFVGSGNDFRINETGVSATMAIKAGGNIGIGMTSPDGRLTVTSATAGPYGTGTPDIAVGGNIGGSTTALQIYRTAATGGNIGIDAFRAGTSGAPLLLNAANGGRVGIGTTSPDEALHVTNTGSDTVMKLGGGGAARDCNFTMFSQSAGNTVQAIHYNGAMAFYSNKFNIQSSGAASLVGSLTQNTSDIRLKTNIAVIENAIDKIKQLSGFTYNWNTLANELGGFDTTIKEVGVAAQSVKEVVPEAVFPAPFDNGFDPSSQSSFSKSGENYLTVQYEKLVPLLIEGIKELKAENDILKEILQRNNIQ